MARTPDRGPLSRERVFETALSLSDRHGLEALSLRLVARELGVTPMALYRYVPGKEALLVGFADLAFAEYEAPTDRLIDWRERFREGTRSFRRVLHRHPAVAALLAARPRLLVPRTLPIVEAALDLLCDAGFTVGEAAQLFSQTTRFILGLVLLEAEGGPGACRDDSLLAAAQSRLGALPVGRYTRLVEATPFLFGACDQDAAFENALDLLVGGMESRLSRRGSSPIDSRRP